MGSSAFDSMVGYLGGDIMKEYKNNRFVIAPQEITNQITAVLCDIEYWYDHHDKLEDWCLEHSCTMKGMTVDIPNDRTLTMWMLRWS